MVNVTRIKELCEPLTKLKPFVKAVWLYGSAARKKEFKKTSDIDILILVDDTREIDDRILKLIEKITKEITEKAAKEKLKLHFQPPKLLVMWWDLVRKGEPWTITSIQNPVVIYDPSDYIRLLSRLLNKGGLYNAPEKSERLLERAREKIGEIRQISLFKAPYELIQAMTEAAQITLMNLHVFPPSPKDVSRELKKHFGKNVESRIIEYYDEILIAVRKINRGHMTELSGKEFDMMTAKARVFIREMESLLINIEKLRKKHELFGAYKECMALCEMALRKSRKPFSEETKLQDFKKYYVDTKLVSQEHYSTLKELEDYAKSDETMKKEMELHLNLSKIRSLKLALMDTVKTWKSQIFRYPS